MIAGMHATVSGLRSPRWPAPSPARPSLTLISRIACSRCASLVTAGITAAIARQYALDSGVKSGSYKPLPPGIQKNLARGKPLPPGIAKKHAPSSMLGRLPQHPGYEWQMAGTDLVLVQIGTAIVADVLKDVFR